MHMRSTHVGLIKCKLFDLPLACPIMRLLNSLIYWFIVNWFTACLGFKQKHHFIDSIQRTTIESTASFPTFSCVVKTTIGGGSSIWLQVPLHPTFSYMLFLTSSEVLKWPSTLNFFMTEKKWLMNGLNQPESIEPTKQLHGSFLSDWINCFRALKHACATFFA